MKIQSLSVGGILLLGSLLLAGCRKDEPEQPHPGEGRISLTIGKVAVALPATCRIYPLAGGAASVEKKSEATGEAWKLEEWLPAGSYRAAVAAFDEKEVEFQAGAGFETSELAVRSGGETAILPLTRPVYLATSAACRLEEEKTTALSLQPVDVRHVLLLTVEAGAGFSDASLEGKLSGVASSVQIATGRPGAKSGSLNLSWQPQTTPGAYTATAGIFGPVAATGNPEKINILALTLTTAAGETFAYEEDLTQPLAEAAAAGRDTFAIALKVAPSVPIRLYTGIQTRATVDAFDATPVSIAVGTESGRYGEHWTGAATGSEIRLDPPRYYPADGSTYYLRSYYPAAPHQAGEVHYELTGQEDLMISVEQSGSLSERFEATGKSLTHRHLLSQLNFTLQLKGASDAYRLRSVQLKGLASKAVISLATGEVQPVGEAGPVIIYTDPGTGGFPIVDGKVTLPGYVLVQPDAELTLDLTLAVDDNPANDRFIKDVPVRFDGGGSEGGNAYNVEISLDLSGDDPSVDPEEPDVTPPTPPTPPDPMAHLLISVKATVIPWKTGEGGSAIL